MLKKVLVLLTSVLLVGGTLTGCIELSESEESYTAKNQSVIDKSVGKPDMSNFFEYAQLKEIYEMRDNPNLVCHWYTRNDYTGKYIYMGKCVGYGIPYGASLTNPEEYEYSGATLPLAEPNGLYTNNVTSSATWVLASDNGKIKPVYVESEITVTQTKLSAHLCEDWSLTSDY